MGLSSVINYAHQLVKGHVHEGDIAIDATIGNGHDTLFLSKLTGNSGIVYGFDIQSQALRNAFERLNQHYGKQATTQLGQSDQFVTDHVYLLKHSHADLLEVIPKNNHGSIAAVMFNLGYLPGGDHNTCTLAYSTLPALNASLQLLRKGGIITIVLYTGHPGGIEEAEAVLNWSQKLPQEQAQVLSYQFINQRNHPPQLIAIEKRF